MLFLSKRLPNMIAVFDLDGTLSLAEHRLHLVKGKKKNYRKFFAASKDDLPFHPIIKIARSLHQSGVTIMIFTGRSDEVREDTEEWLEKHLGVPHVLVMRQQNDFTPDHHLKRSWLNDPGLINKDEILCVFDDRARVVEMWRSEGLTCLQVAPGDF